MGNSDSAFVKEITAKNTLYLASYKSRDMKVIANMYTDDCRFMPAGFPLQEGKEGIADFWMKVANLGYDTLFFETLETIGPIRDYAIERCWYNFKDASGKELQRGKYIVVWKKERGEWKYHWDIWNPDTLQ